MIKMETLPYGTHGKNYFRHWRQVKNYLRTYLESRNSVIMVSLILPIKAWHSEGSEGLFSLISKGQGFLFHWSGRDMVKIKSDMMMEISPVWGLQEKAPIPYDNWWFSCMRSLTVVRKTRFFQLQKGKGLWAGYDIGTQTLLTEAQLEHLSWMLKWINS